MDAIPGPVTRVTRTQAHGTPWRIGARLLPAALGALLAIAAHLLVTAEPIVVAPLRWIGG